MPVIIISVLFKLEHCALIWTHFGDKINLLFYTHEKVSRERESERHLDSEYGCNLPALRKRLDMTQADLAAKIGVCKSSLTSIENKKRR